MVHLLKKTRGLVLEYLKTISLLARVLPTITPSLVGSTAPPVKPACHALSLTSRTGHMLGPLLGVLSPLPLPWVNVYSSLKPPLKRDFSLDSHSGCPQESKELNVGAPIFFCVQPCLALNSLQPPDQSSERSGSASGFSPYRQF